MNHLSDFARGRVSILLDTPSSKSLTASSAGSVHTQHLGLAPNKDQQCYGEKTGKMAREREGLCAPSQATMHVLVLFALGSASSLAHQYHFSALLLHGSN